MEDQALWNERFKLFKEWVEHGGFGNLEAYGLVDDLERVRWDDEGNVTLETLGQPLKLIMRTMHGAQVFPPPYSGKDQVPYGSLLNKSRFIKPVAIDTEEQFDGIWAAHHGKTDYLYRGQREAIWQLYTTGQRAWITDRLHESEATYEGFLVRLLHNARTMHGGMLPQYLRGIGLLPDSDIAILSFLQHYGAPTPLQDWTWSFGNAVFFAHEGLRKDGDKEADSYCSVYHLPESGFSSAGLKDVFDAAWAGTAPKMRAESREAFIAAGHITAEEFDKRIDIDRAEVGAKRRFAALFITEFVTIERLMSEADHWPMTYFSDRDDFPELSFSLNNSLNIQNQKGVFMFNTHEALPVEQVGFNWREQDHGTTEGYRFCGCWNINKKLEDYIRRKLEEAGITRDFIYPDPAPMNFGMDPKAFAKDVYETTKKEGKDQVKG